jgi:ribosomal protein S18 acetylase RimI-like enzyme
MLVQYPLGMSQIESLSTKNLDGVVARVVAHQMAVSASNPLISALVDTATLAEGLLSNVASFLVARDGDEVLGHLGGAVISSDPDGASVWVGPDSLSYDSVATLEQLYEVQAENWLERGASRQFVWSPTHECAPWLELGFSYVHQRGVRRLRDVGETAMPPEYQIRRGTLDDLEVALELDAVMDAEQRGSPSFLVTQSEARSQWMETLEDPETVHVIVECDGRAIAQCLWFPLSQRVGTFDRCVHLSAVTVIAQHRRRGVARAMVDHILHIAQRDGFDYVETNWRVSNRRAARYWLTYGFSPTYTRLQRAIGAS